MRLPVVSLILVVLLLVPGMTAEATTLYVAPDGNDLWSGRVERPRADGSDGPLAGLGTGGVRVGDTRRN